MFVTCAALSVLLALAFFAGGAMKLASSRLSGGPIDAVVETINHVGAGDRLRLIALLELAGAAGTVVGLAVAPVGVAAAVGLSSMMALAVASHRRVGDDFKLFAGPLALGLLAVAAAVLRVLSL